MSSITMTEKESNCDHCGQITDERAMVCVTHPDWIAHGETMPSWVCMACYYDNDYQDFEE